LKVCERNQAEVLEMPNFEQYMQVTLMYYLLFLMKLVNYHSDLVVESMFLKSWNEMVGIDHLPWT